MAPFRSSASAGVYCAPTRIPLAPVAAPAASAALTTSASTATSSATALFAASPVHTNGVWRSHRLARQPAALAFCYPHSQQHQLVLLDRYRHFHTKHEDELSHEAHVASTSAWQPKCTALSALPLLLPRASASAGKDDAVDERAAHPQALEHGQTQRAQAQAAEQRSHAALHVLVTRELLEHITDFARGVPSLLTTFVHTSSRSTSASRARPLSPFVDPPSRRSDISTSSRSDGDGDGDGGAPDARDSTDEHDQDDDQDDDRWDACYDPQASNGLVARLAVERDNRRVLRMLLRLHAFPVYRRKRKLRLEMVVLWCVELGRLELLEWLVPRLPASVSAVAAAAPAALLDAAVQNGDVAMLEWLARHGFAAAASYRVSLTALEQTPLARVCAVFEWFYAALGDASFVTEALVTELARRGCLDALAFVHRITSATATATALAISSSFSSTPVDTASRDATGSSTASVVFSRAAMDAAAHSGHLDVVAFLHKHRGEGCSTAALDGAAANGHLGVVRFLHTHRHEGGTTRAMDVAAANGHLGVVQFLHAHRTEGSTTAAMNRAARNGHLAVVQFLHEHRRECGTFAALDGAALGGHLDVVTYLHRVRGGDAAGDGDGDSDGVGVCTALAMDNAASAGHLAIVQFLHAHRREGCTTKAMDLAAHNGHLDVVAFLHAHRREGCTRAAMNLAASAGHLDVVAFLHEHRREGCTKRALSMAARNGFTPVVRFLLEHRTEGCGEDALRAAYRSGRFEVARYLHSRGFMGDVAKCVVSCCCSTVAQYS